MASLAVSLAIHNEQVSAEIIEANEFPDLAQRYSVYGVPRTVINESVAVEGAVGESVLVQKILDATQQKKPKE